MTPMGRPHTAVVRLIVQMRANSAHGVPNTQNQLMADLGCGARTHRWNNRPGHRSTREEESGPAKKGGDEMTDKCPSCGFKMSELVEVGNRSKTVCRHCGKQIHPLRESRPICPKCGISALCVLSPKEHPGKLLFVHHSGDMFASGCLVDAPDFGTADQ